MKIISGEFTTELLEGNIISQKVNDDCTEITKEGAIKVVENMNKLAELKTPSTKMVSYIPSFYVKKEAIKVLTAINPSIRFLAVIASGYISKYIASIAIKVQQRLHKDEANPLVIKIFMAEDEAMKWLYSQ